MLSLNLSFVGRLCTSTRWSPIHRLLSWINLQYVACSWRLNYGQPSDLGHVDDSNICENYGGSCSTFFYVHEEYAFIARVYIDTTIQASRSLFNDLTVCYCELFSYYRCLRIDKICTRNIRTPRIYVVQFQFVAFINLNICIFQPNLGGSVWGMYRWREVI